MLSIHHGFVGICLLLAVGGAGGPDGVNQRVFLYQGRQRDQVGARMSGVQWVDWGRDGDAQPPAALPPLPMATVQPPGPAGCVPALLRLILPGAWKLFPHPSAAMFSSPSCASAAVAGLGLHPHWMCCQQLGCDTIPWVRRVPKGCAGEPERDNGGQTFTGLGWGWRSPWPFEDDEARVVAAAWSRGQRDGDGVTAGVGLVAQGPVPCQAL